MAELPLLSALPCFSRIKKIQKITTGLSCHCYQVSADNKVFFAKKITTTVESTACSLAANINICPKVIYHDKQWLITEFVQGENLSTYQLSTDKKIAFAIKLMAQCHQLPIKVSELKPMTTVNDLIDVIHTSTLNNVFQSKSNQTLNSTDLRNMATNILKHLPHTTSLVCCHGDINFSNVMLTSTEQAYLVDYECACAAPAEYDLAMFIAVNNLSEQPIKCAIKQYRKYTSMILDLALIHHYLQFCYLINSLWYLIAFQKSERPNLIILAKQQWQKLKDNTLILN